jgi:hypothetical protein
LNKSLRRNGGRSPGGGNARGSPIRTGLPRTIFAYTILVKGLGTPHGIASGEGELCSPEPIAGGAGPFEGPEIDR